MKKLLITLLILSSITSAYAASTFQWSRLSHTRLNNFVRLTKLPVGQYLIGVYSTGNTIQQYNGPEIQTIEKIKEVQVIKEVPVEVTKTVVVEKKLPIGTIVITPEEKANLRTRCYDNWYGWNQVCVDEFLYSKFIK